MYRIVLVIDEHFGHRLIDLARTAYVWIVQSAENDPWAQRVWDERSNNGDPLLNGVTTFQHCNGDTTDDMVMRLLEMIDEHHGEFAHDPQWSEIEVIGTSLTKAIEDEARIYGVERCTITPTGFRLIRVTSD